MGSNLQAEVITGRLRGRFLGRLRWLREVKLAVALHQSLGM
jgi:hypothetical protein